MHRQLFATALLGVAVLTGCSGSSSGGAHAGGPTGVRGTELPAFSCAAKATGTAIRVAPAAVTTLRVCPVVAPSPFNKPATAVTLPVGDPRFTDLLRALSLPDLPRAKGMMCPLYADLVQPVLARTASTAILVHLPVDGCDHVLSSVRSALAVVVNA